MAQKLKDAQAIGKEIKSYFNRNQGWLARQIEMSEAQLSRKINGMVEWSQDELDRINKVLGTKLKL
jgi:plasmid maintenance system antidote protein VapI